MKKSCHKPRMDNPALDEKKKFSEARKVIKKKRIRLVHHYFRYVLQVITPMVAVIEIEMYSNYRNTSNPPQSKES